MQTTELKQSLSTCLPADRIGSVEQTAELLAALGDCVPKVSARPASREEAAGLLCWARDHGVALIPRGSGTKLAIGNRPDRGDLFLDTRELEPWIQPMPEDLVVRVSAGTRLVDLQEALSASGLRLPLDPPDAGQASIGGLAATNSFGPLHTGHGMLRDMILGMQVITPDGRITRSGGHVVKNVTGYDLPKLHVGALGTLGLITEITLRLLPCPASAAGLIRPYTSPIDAWEDCRAVRASGRIEPQAMEIFGSEAAGDLRQGGAPYTLWLHFEGSTDSVTARLQAARSRLDRGTASSRTLTQNESRLLGQRLAQGRSVAAGGSGLLLGRVVARPSQIGELLDAIQTLAADLTPDVQIFVSPASGILDARVDEAGDLTARSDPLIAAARRITGLHAHLFLLAAPLGLREELDVMGGVPEAMAVIEAIKQTFDAATVLNPGRHVGGL